MYDKNWRNLIFVSDWIFFSVNIRSLNNALKFIECFQVLLVLKLHSLISNLESHFESRVLRNIPCFHNHPSSIASKGE